MKMNHNSNIDKLIIKEIKELIRENYVILKPVKTIRCIKI